MTVKVVTRGELPKATRNRVPKLMQTPDWRVAAAQMVKGLKPEQVLMLIFSVEEMRKYGINNIRNASRPLKRWVKAHGLPYTVIARNTPEGGVVTIEAKAAATRRRKTA
jgi:hypothetical protein